jgi:glucosamine kinase
MTKSATSQAGLAWLIGVDGGGLLAGLVLRQMGSARADMQHWCGRAGQGDHAALAPVVIDAAADGDPVADEQLQAAAEELVRLKGALQPVGAVLPVVLARRVGTGLRSRWPAVLRARRVEASGDALDGALWFLRATPTDTRN